MTLPSENTTGALVNNPLRQVGSSVAGAAWTSGEMPNKASIQALCMAMTPNGGGSVRQDDRPFSRTVSPHAMRPTAALV